MSLLHRGAPVGANTSSGSGLNSRAMRRVGVLNRSAAEIDCRRRPEGRAQRVKLMTIWSRTRFARRRSARRIAFAPLRLCRIRLRRRRHGETLARYACWLFIGAAEAGERGAILYTTVEACRRRSINPYEHLRDALTRLPKIRQQDIASVTPAAWAKARNSAPHRRAA